jgi:hypothetical protein
MVSDHVLFGGVLVALFLLGAEEAHAQVAGRDAVLVAYFEASTLPGAVFADELASELERQIDESDAYAAVTPVMLVDLLPPLSLRLCGAVRRHPALL